MCTVFNQKQQVTTTVITQSEWKSGMLQPTNPANNNIIKLINTIALIN